MNRILIFVLTVFINCSTNQSSAVSNYIKVKFVVKEIDEFENMYRFKGFINGETDTVYAISHKMKIDSAYFPIPVSEQQIIINKKYNFTIEKVRPRVSVNNRSYHFIVIDTDTIWSGTVETVPPRYYIIRNAIGLKMGDVSNMLI